MLLMYILLMTLHKLDKAEEKNTKTLPSHMSTKAAQLVHNSSDKTHKVFFQSII